MTVARSRHRGRPAVGDPENKPVVSDDWTPATDDAPVVLVVMGVSGSGKSTVAGVLVGLLGWDFVEGDDLHPASNIAKMASGHPLTDEDRWPWLARIAAWIGEHTAAGRPGVVTCSALKRSYRDVLRGPGVAFVYLAGTREEIRRRLVARHGHFMPPSLLDSQFATLQPPEQGEHAITVAVTGTPRQHAAQIIAALGLTAPGRPRSR